MQNLDGQADDNFYPQVFIWAMDMSALRGADLRPSRGLKFTLSRLEERLRDRGTGGRLPWRISPTPRVTVRLRRLGRRGASPDYPNVAAGEIEARASVPRMITDAKARLMWLSLRLEEGQRSSRLTALPRRSSAHVPNTAAVQGRPEEKCPRPASCAAPPQRFQRQPQDVLSDVERMRFVGWGFLENLV